MNIRILSFIALTFISNICAADVVEDTIGSYVVHEGEPGKAIFMFHLKNGHEQLKGAGEGCNGVSESISKGFAISLETELGRSMMALIMTAAASNYRVSILYHRKCRAWADRFHPVYTSAAAN